MSDSGHFTAASPNERQEHACAGKHQQPRPSGGTNGSMNSEHVYKGLREARQYATIGHGAHGQGGAHGPLASFREGIRSW